MRRVVTGEEIAQVRGPDPFAVPAWRSPGLPDARWRLLAIVHLVRMIARLVGFLFRHPVCVPGRHRRRADVAGDLAGWAWCGPGRDQHRSAAGAVAVAVSRPRSSRLHRWPRLVRQWQAWRYRQAVGRGDDHRPPGPGLPGPGAAAGVGQGVGNALHRTRVRVRLVSGQSAADFAARADNLAHGFGAMLCRIRSASPGALVLEFVRRDALAAVIPALAIPVKVRLAGAAGRPPRRRPDLGGPGARHARADRRGHRGWEGLAAVVDWCGPCSRDAGTGWSGSGPLIPKLMELAYGRAIFDRYGRYAADRRTRSWPCSRTR